MINRFGNMFIKCSCLFSSNFYKIVAELWKLWPFLSHSKSHICWSKWRICLSWL